MMCSAGLKKAFNHVQELWIDLQLTEASVLLRISFLFMLFALSCRLSWLSSHKHGTFLIPAPVQTHHCCWEEYTLNVRDSEGNYDYEFLSKNAESWWTPANTSLYLQTSDTPHFHLQHSCTSSTQHLWLVVMHEVIRVLSIIRHLSFGMRDQGVPPLSSLPFTQV